jgi:hypothetical protein
MLKFEILKTLGGHSVLLTSHPSLIAILCENLGTEVEKRPKDALFHWSLMGHLCVSRSGEIQCDQTIRSARGSGELCCWLVVWIMIFFDFPFSWEWNVMIPTDVHSIIFQRGRAQPPGR